MAAARNSAASAANAVTGGPAPRRARRDRCARCARGDARRPARSTRPPARNRAGAAHSSQVRGATGGLQQDEVAVALRHEGVDLRVALAGANQRLDLAAQVRGERRIGVGDALAAADEAAQVADQPLVARLLGGSSKRWPESTAPASGASSRQATSAAMTRITGWPPRRQQRQELALPDLQRDRPDVLLHHAAGPIDEERLGRAVHAPVDGRAPLRVEGD